MHASQAIGRNTVCVIGVSKKTLCTVVDNNTGTTAHIRTAAGRYVAELTSYRMCSYTQQHMCTLFCDRVASCTALLVLSGNYYYYWFAAQMGVRWVYMYTQLVCPLEANK